MLKQGFKRLTKDLSYTMGRVLQVAEALEYLQMEAIPGVCSIRCGLAEQTYIREGWGGRKKSGPCTQEYFLRFRRCLETIAASCAR